MLQRQSLTITIQYAKEQAEILNFVDDFTT